MPEVSRTNTNIPTIMIAERVAEMMRAPRGGLSRRRAAFS